MTLCYLWLDKVYFYTPRKQALSNHAWINKIGKKQVEEQTIIWENSQWWYWNLLEVTFKKKLHDEENEDHLKILTLGIYGLVLFQSVEGMIDFETVNMSKVWFLSKSIQL